MITEIKKNKKQTNTNKQASSKGAPQLTLKLNHKEIVNIVKHVDHKKF